MTIASLRVDDRIESDCAILRDSRLKRGVTKWKVPKGAGDVRPIAIGRVLRRFIGRLLAAPLSRALAPTLTPHQLGVGIAAGPEALAATVRAAHADGATIIRLDVKNAFNCISRHTVRAAVAKVVPDLLPLYDTTHGESQLYLAADDFSTTIPSREGVQQGDPLSGILYAVAAEPAMREVRSAFPSVSVVALHDDTVVIGRGDVLHDATALLLQSLQRRGLECQPAKCCALGTDAGVVADLGITTTSHLTVAGCPIGDAQHQQSHCDEVAAMAAARCNLIRTLQDPHHEWALTAATVTTLATYTCRTVSPTIFAAAADAIDATLRNAVARYAGCDACEIPRYAHLASRLGGLGLHSARLISPARYAGCDACEIPRYAHLPSRLGGLGLHSARLTSPAAFLGAAAQVRPLVQAALQPLLKHSVTYDAATLLFLRNHDVTPAPPTVVEESGPRPHKCADSCGRSIAIRCTAGRCVLCCAVSHPDTHGCRSCRLHFDTVVIPPVTGLDVKLGIPQARRSYVAALPPEHRAPELAHRAIALATTMRHPQHVLSHVMHLAHRHNLWHAADISLRARMTSWASPTARAWLRTPPIAHLGLHLAPHEFRVAMRMRLDLQCVDPPTDPCSCLTGKTIAALTSSSTRTVTAPYDYHARTCGKGATTAIHNALVHTVCTIARQCHRTVQREQKSSTDINAPDARPGDLTIAEYTPGITAFIDVTRCDIDATHNAMPAATRMGGAATAAARRKMTKYAELAKSAPSTGITFVPIAFDHLGAVDLDRGLPALKHLAALLAQERLISIPDARNRVYSRLSVALYRATAAAYAQAMPHKRIITAAGSGAGSTARQHFARAPRGRANQRVS